MSGPYFLWTALLFWHTLAISRPCHVQGATKVMKQSVSAEQIELKSSLPEVRKCMWMDHEKV